VIGLILKPENVDTYEAGYKAMLFDRQVQFTSAIFYNKYKGIHVTTSGTTGNTDISNALINLGTARTYGAEAAITWRLSPALTVSGNIGYLNAKYQKAVFPGNALLLPRNASGNQMILAPHWQGGAQLNYDNPINDRLRLKGNVLFAYISHHYFTTDENRTADRTVMRPSTCAWALPPSTTRLAPTCSSTTCSTSASSCSVRAALSAASRCRAIRA